MSGNRKTLIFADRNGLSPGGPAKLNRRKHFTTEKRRHPMVTRAEPGTVVDYFRTSCARYFQWRTGIAPGDYGTYGYLYWNQPWESADIFEAPPSDLYIGFKFEELSHDYADGVIATADGIATLPTYYHNTENQLLEKTSHMFGRGGYINYTAPNAPWTVYPDMYYAHTPFPYNQSAAPQIVYATPAALREKVEITIRAEEDAWKAAADQWGVEQPYSQLNMQDHVGGEPVPSWVVWHNYVLGSLEPRLSQTWYGEQAAAGELSMPGLFGPRTMNSTYYDHYFANYDMPETNATTQVSPQYTYYAANYQAFSSSVLPLETLIPNYYTVMSLLKNGDNDWAWTSPENNNTDSLYQNAGVGNIADVLGLYGHIGTDVVSQDGALFQNSTGISIGLVTAGTSNPDSILSRFARTNFSLLSGSKLQNIDNFNKHLGFSSRIVRGPNSILSEMSAESNTELVPYGLNLNLTALPTSNFLNCFDDLGNDLDYQDGMIDYFLYEVMKANICNYTNIDPTTATDYLGAKYPAYHTMSFSTLEVLDLPTPQTNFYGFNWTGAGSNGNNPYPWADNVDPQADVAGKSSLRAIDFNHLILQWGSHRASLFGATNVFSGLVGQTTTSWIATPRGGATGGTKAGFIIGRPLNEGPGLMSIPNPSAFDNAVTQNMGSEDIPSSALIDMGEWLPSRIRSYEQMLQGQYAHNETIAYRIDKHSVDEQGTESSVIQSFYLPAMSPTFSLFDSQVLYGHQYKYKIYAYQLVIGNQYNYTNESVLPAQIGPYPTRLARIMGFREDTNYRTVPDDYSDNNTAGTNQAIGQAGIYLAQNTVRFAPNPVTANYTGDGPEVLINHGNILADAAFPFAGSRARGWLTDNGYGMPLVDEFFNPNYNAYADIVNGEIPNLVKQSLEISSTAYMELDSANRPLSIGGTYWARPADFIEEMNQVLGPNYIVRLLINPGDMSEGRFLIARREVLLNLTDVEKADALEALLSHSGFDGFPYLIHVNDAAGEYQVSVSNFSLTDIFNAFFLESAPLESPPSYAPFAIADAAAAGGPATGIASYAAIAPRHRQRFQFETGLHGLAPQLPYDSDYGKATVTVNNFNSIKILEIPYSTTNLAAVHDLPPMPPNVEFYPVRNDPTKVKILINQNNFTYSALPVAIEENDANIFLSMYQTQGRPTGSAILFGADDTDVRFEMYRLSGTPPESYLDFRGQMREDSESRTAEGHSVTSTAFLDTIEPNINYYYCFRTKDIGNWISNPTGVIRVQLVDDNGRMYPIIEPYTLRNLSPIVTEKPLKKYLEIGASLEETLIVVDDDTAPTAGSPFNIPTNVVLGTPGSVMQDSINKSFKIRLTSKDTGKEIDLNVKFNVDMIANPNLVEEN